MNARIVGPILALLAGGLLLGAASPQLRVRVQGERLTLHADGVPLEGVLWSISAQTGIRLNIEAGAASVLVKDDFEDLTLERGIMRLLQRHLKQSSYTVVVAKDKAVVESIHILSVATGASPAAGPRSAAPSPAALNTSAGEASDRLSARNPRTRGASVTGIIDAYRAASTEEAQIEALQALGQYQQDPQGLEVLHEALASESGGVRKAALEAMRWATVGDGRVLESVRGVVDADTDPGVRESALEVLVRYDESPEARALLQRLSTEEGGAHREFAARELKRLDSEAEARRQPDTQATGR